MASQRFEPADDGAREPREQPMTRVLRLEVVACVDHGDAPLERGRHAADDASWNDWLARWEQGRAIVARLRTVARFDVEGTEQQVDIQNDGVWIERELHVPKVEEQVREIAYKDASKVADEVAARGGHVMLHDVEEMFFHVRLEDELRRWLLDSDDAEAVGSRS